MQAKPSMRPWYRLEVEYHNELAGRCLDAWQADGWEGVAGCVNATLSLREPSDTDSNPARWPLWRPWQALLGAPPARPRAVANAAAARWEERLAWAGTATAKILGELQLREGPNAVVAWARQVAEDGERQIRRARHEILEPVSPAP